MSEKLTKEQYAERGAEVTRTQKSPGWALVRREYEESVERLKEEALSTDTDSSRTEAIKEALVILDKNHPDAIADRLIFSARHNS